MAYNMHFIKKRKHVNVTQTNSSARILPSLEDTLTPNQIDLDDARRTGVMSLSAHGLTNVPDEIYSINLPGDRRLTYNGFEDDKCTAWWKDILLHTLDLSCNKINCIAPDIKHLSNLSDLNLTDNNLSNLPIEMEELTQITYLNISKNQFKTLPHFLGSLQMLKQLIVAHNYLSDLPESFCKLSNLEVLDLSNNQFLNIPEMIGEFKSLKNLSLACNNTKETPASMVQLKNLTSLDLSQNRLSKFPQISDAKFEILKLNINCLMTFPIIRCTPSLKELNISNNLICNFSEVHVSFIPNIKILEMSKNTIESIPPSVAHLTSLIHLDISFNNLKSIPYELGYIISLTNLNVEGNPFRSIKRIAMTNGTEFFKNYLRNRNNDDPNSYYIIPKKSHLNEKQNDSNIAINLNEINYTKTLNLSNKELASIPDECFEFLINKVIRTINFSSNKLTIFPSNVVVFGKNLQNFDISTNWILDLPDIFHNFNCIETLNLSGNYLRNLPDSFAYMSETLLSLNLAHNPLGTSVPNVIFKLKSLQYLNISDCLIMELNPKKFLKLEKLSNLDISNNDIKILPPQLGLCQQIKTLNVGGNRTDLSKEHLTSTEALLQHLRSLIQELA